MSDFLQRLKQRKLVQWALAYLATAWVVLQVLGLASESYGWSHLVMHIAFGVLALGFVVVLVLAWYHGERGVQRINGVELLIIALVLAVGGGVLWNFARPPTNVAQTGQTIASTGSPEASSSPDAAQRNPGTRLQTLPDSAAAAASSRLRVASVPIAAQPIPAKSVAVLPFESLSSDKNNAYFADGMQDLILTKLADIGDLKVIARTSTMQYGSHPQNLTLVGKQLGVATILEGSVQKAGKQVLINVQLIDTKTDLHIWAESYTRTLDNIFGVEGEVADKVAKALDAKLSAAQTAQLAEVPTTNPQAYTLYLRAQYALDQFDNGDAQPVHLLQAKHYLKQAIAQDPKFAAAYADLAIVEDRMRSYAIEDPDASVQNIVTLAKKSLALQPDLATGHIALGAGLLRKGARKNSGQALQEWQTAARLAPNDADVATRLGHFHWNVGNWRQAEIDWGKALRLDPRSGRNYENVAFAKGALRHYGAARQTLEHGLAISPNDQLLHLDMANLLMLLGNPAGARAQLSSLSQNARGRPGSMMNAWMLSRNYAEALKFAKQVPHRNIWVDAGHPQMAVGRAALAAGDTPRAHAAFEQARSKVRAALKQHPDATPPLYDSLAAIEMWSGHREAALQAIDKAIAMAFQQPNLRSASSASGVARYPRLYETKAEVLAHFGDAADATTLLDKLFEAQGTGWLISHALLKLAPVWDPIRHDPRFQALLKKYARASPAVASTAAPGATP